ncbi:leucine transporter subunit; periplasmic-binding component of ABC superfamily [uncultured Alphaproteobacteria bacterium]|uniref:Leucine transporter subunit periplasmic-binding component of ABC superfamily n=1 Tax=uncultured Alphaproteobacteria bacterium TaxID=91750 RepID=A0A212J368_9PROT|nr:leucine transporter subunit; periplasmic-binding component of ABC superfamily [uncultured Alphaproteobacteria bacterium]
MLKAAVYVGAVLSVLASGAAQADILIGVAGPRSGGYANFGEQVFQGADLAVKEINAKGGVLGEKLKLVVGDDACDPKQAVSVANQFANEGVVFVAGHFCSGSSIPASAVYQDEGIVMMSFSSTNPKLTEQGFANIYRVCGRDDQQGPVAAALIADRFKGEKIAILHDKTGYGKGLADSTKAQLNARGIQETMYEAYTAGEKDYSALVTKMKQAGIGVIYLGGYHSEGGLIIRQAREQGLQARMISGDGLATSEFGQIAGKAADGTLFTFTPDPRKDKANAPIVEAFRASGYEPEGYTLNSYAIIQIFAQAAAQAKSTKAEALNKVLHSATFTSLLGKVEFDAKGDPKSPGYKIYEWKNGSFDYMQ